MKRKLIELGNGCLVVSLPMKYVRKQVLKKGEEMQLVEEGNDLRLSKGQPTERSVSYNYDVARNERMGRRLVIAAYRLGVSEFKLSYDQPNYFETLHRLLLEETVGFEVINQEARSCTIRDLSKTSFEEFDSTVQRCWSLLLDLANNTLEGVRASDYELLKTMRYKDRSVNKFTNYALRMLVKGSALSLAKTITYYQLINSLEELGDDYQDMATHISAQRLELSKGHVSVLEELNKRLGDFFRVLRKFEDSAAEEAANAVAAIQEELQNETMHKKGSPVIAYYLMSICYRIRNLMLPIVQLDACGKAGL